MISRRLLMCAPAIVGYDKLMKVRPYNPLWVQFSFSVSTPLPRGMIVRKEIIGLGRYPIFMKSLKAEGRGQYDDLHYRFIDSPPPEYGFLANDPVLVAWTRDAGDPALA